MSNLGLRATMPISGLVLTLDHDPHVRAELLTRLHADPRIFVGQPEGTRLPIVTETRGLEEAEELARDLMSRAGVVFLDVVTVSFEDEER